MLSVTYAKCHLCRESHISLVCLVIYKPFMLSDIMLNVIMLSVMAPIKTPLTGLSWNSSRFKNTVSVQIKPQWPLHPRLHSLPALAYSGHCMHAYTQQPVFHLQPLQTTACTLTCSVQSSSSSLQWPLHPCLHALTSLTAQAYSAHCMHAYMQWSVFQLQPIQQHP